MKKLSLVIATIISVIFIFSNCSENKANAEDPMNDSTVATNAYGGYESQVQYGEHIVAIAGCNDCHTPKKMGAQGPEIDYTLSLSGHSGQMPVPDVDRKEMEGKGLAVTNDLTAWVGPWGISYAANITSDSTGIGNWKEDQFLLCIRQGKSKGLSDNRQLLPPMPWRELNASMTDNELKAIFAYLKTTKAIHNVVPQRNLLCQQ